MAKRPPIMLGSKRLHECRIVEIVDIASHPLRKRFAERPDAPHYTNRNIIEAFAGTSERTTSEIIAKYPGGSEDWSDESNALRVGEALGWALQEGIVERVTERGRVHQHRWRLIHAEPQFENIMRSVRRRSIRILNAGPLQAENDKLWAREMKARARRHQRDLASVKPVILKSIALICRCAPGFDISAAPGLARFAIGGFTSIAECRELIEQSVDGMQGVELYQFRNELHHIRIKLDIDVRSMPPPPSASPEALAELDDFSL